MKATLLRATVLVAVIVTIKLMLDSGGPGRPERRAEIGVGNVPPLTQADELAPLLSDLRTAPESKPDAMARLASGLRSEDRAVRKQTARTIELLARDQARQGVDPRSPKAEAVIRLLSELRQRNPEYFNELVSRNDGTAFGSFLREVQS